MLVFNFQLLFIFPCILKSFYLLFPIICPLKSCTLSLISKMIVAFSLSHSPFLVSLWASIQSLWSFICCAEFVLSLLKVFLNDATGFSYVASLLDSYMEYSSDHLYYLPFPLQLQVTILYHYYFKFSVRQF